MDEDDKDLQKAIESSLTEAKKSTKTLASASKQQKSPKKAREIMRLTNKGCSCFVNASLQLIDSLDFSRNKVVNDNEHETTKLLVDFITKKRDDEALDKLLKQKDPITSIQYYNNSQEDTGEFLIKMLAFLNEKYINVTVQEITSFVNCINDEFPEPKTENSNYINLYLNNKKNSDLKSLLDFNQKTIELEKPTEISGCTSNKLTYMPKRTTRNIIIQISRFSGKSYLNNEKSRKKIIPNPILTFENGSQFELTGCIIHKGETIANGHYTYLSFKKNGEPHQYIDDLGGKNYVQDYKKLEKTKEMKEINYVTNGYIYLYTKKTD